MNAIIMIVYIFLSSSLRFSNKTTTKILIRFLSVYHSYNHSIRQISLIPTDFSTKHITTYYYTSSEKLSQSLLKNRIRTSDILSINIFSLANIILVRYLAPSGVNFTTLIITSKANAQTTFLLKKLRRDILL